MSLAPQVLRIVMIDLVLSGDNAVVIGMAAHRLEPRQRKAAILLGGGAAIVLRVTLTAVATLLLSLSGLQLVGGLLLLWIGFKLLKQEEESHEGVKAAASMKAAVVTILVADFIMSLDNVIGVAGASEGDIGLLMFGLVLSMVILMFMGSLVAGLINKFWWLAYAGASVIAWTGAELIFKEPFVHARIPLEGVASLLTNGVISATVLLAAHWFHRSRIRESSAE